MAPADFYIVAVVEIIHFSDHSVWLRAISRLHSAWPIVIHSAVSPGRDPVAAQAESKVPEAVALF